MHNDEELQALRNELVLEKANRRLAKSKLGLLSMHLMLLGTMGRVDEKCAMARSHVEPQWHISFGAPMEEQD